MTLRIDGQDSAAVLDLRVEVWRDRGDGKGLRARDCREEAEAPGQDVRRGLRCVRLGAAVRSLLMPAVCPLPVGLVLVGVKSRIELTE